VTKQEYIEHWLNVAGRDWEVCQSLFGAGHYKHSLFAASVVLERLLKGLWVKGHGLRMPPKIPELERMAIESNAEFPEEELSYLREVNHFATEVLCPDPENPYPWKFTREFAERNLERIQAIALELKQKIQG
jgi:HEPN domain-containing protein